MKGVHDMGAKLRALSALAQNRSNHSDPSQVDEQALRLASDLRSGVIQIEERLGSLPYPFVHPRGPFTIAEYLQAGLAQHEQHEWHRSYEIGTAHVNRLLILHYRLVGRILALADLAEKGLDHASDHAKMPL